MAPGDLFLFLDCLGVASGAKIDKKGTAPRAFIKSQGDQKRVFGDVMQHHWKGLKLKLALLRHKVLPHNGCIQK